MKQQTSTAIDLHDYDSPIKRADGTVPYNGYLWPTEDWWLKNEPQFHYFSGRFNFGIVALNDGRFSVEGAISHIEKNTDNPYPRKDDPSGHPVVFDTRHKAIRVSAARMIRDIRSMRYMKPMNIFDHLDRCEMEKAINWAREIVAKECGAVNMPLPITIPEPPPPPPTPTGLELIDLINKRDHADKLKPNKS